MFFFSNRTSYPPLTSTWQRSSFPTLSQASRNALLAGREETFLVQVAKSVIEIDLVICTFPLHLVFNARPMFACFYICFYAFQKRHALYYFERQVMSILRALS